MRGADFGPSNRFRWRLTLLQRSTALGVLVTTALAILFSHILSEHMIKDALRDSADNASTITTALITPHITAGDFARPTPRTVAAWRQRVASVAGKFDIVRIKVWSPNGTVVYSDEEDLIGRKFPLSDELEDALKGSVAKEITTLSREENAAEKAYGKLLEVYVPVTAPGSTTVVGVYEVYHSFTPIQAVINNIRTTVWTGSLIVFSVLFASLFALARGASRQLHHMAYHDPLTGLANRRLLRERAEHVLALARRYGRIVALLYLDLARFKAVNDSLGHSAGDELLKLVAGRLRLGLRESDALVRTGGDEFAILLSEMRGKEDATLVARRILEQLRPAFYLRGQSVHIEGNLGITVYPEDGTSYDELIQHADVAMYRAKGEGIGFQFYQPQLEVYTRDRLLLEVELRDALDRSALVLHYQPVVNIATGEVTGAETLVRWPHPQRGMVPPDDFIPLAAESDLILQLDRWVIEQAVRQAHAWAECEWQGWVAVNVSARSLSDPELPDYLENVLEEAKLCPDRLMLEITEGEAMREPDMTVRLLSRISALGILLAIDDFGMGYSFLAYLKHFPIAELKIDRSFVRGIGRDPKDERLIETVMTLSNSLRLSFVAEGVENTDQLMWLRSHGCGLAQGHLLGRPVPPNEFPLNSKHGTLVAG